MFSTAHDILSVTDVWGGGGGGGGVVNLRTCLALHMICYL